MHIFFVAWMITSWNQLDVPQIVQKCRGNNVCIFNLHRWGFSNVFGTSFLSFIFWLLSAVIKFILLAAHTVDAHPRIGGSHCSYLEAVVYGTSVLWLCTCLIVTNCLTYHGTLRVAVRLRINKAKLTILTSKDRTGNEHCKNCRFAFLFHFSMISYSIFAELPNLWGLIWKRSVDHHSSS